MCCNVHYLCTNISHRVQCAPTVTILSSLKTVNLGIKWLTVTVYIQMSEVYVFLCSELLNEECFSKF